MLKGIQMFSLYLFKVDVILKITIESKFNTTSTSTRVRMK